MAQFKFSCPNCTQNIECDEQWGGHQIQCPSCQGNLVVPYNNATAAPPPPSPKPAGLKVTAERPQSSPPPPPPRHPIVQSRHAAPAPKQTKEKSSPVKYVKIGSSVLLLLVGMYFLFGWLMKMQDKVSTLEVKGDGGQVGHIADLYDVLDKTEPTHPGMSSAEAKAEEERQARYEARMKKEEAEQRINEPAEAAEPANTVATTNDTPLIPAVWNLDLATTSIPESRVNGKISGANFVGDTARIVKVGSADVLTFRQGSGPTSDAELFIYLRLNAGEQLAGHSWTISKEMKGKEVPQVIKRWKKDPRFAAAQKAFTTGYAMKLEFGQITDGALPGKVFIALPDTEQSVAAGVFKATLPVSTVKR